VWYKENKVGKSNSLYQLVKPVPPAFRIQKRGLREGKITRLSDSVEKKKIIPPKETPVL